MINYEMKDLIPVVAKLVDRYTSKESTSVQMEVAKQLLGAVIYCIQQNEEDFQVASKLKFEAEAAYQQGYERVIEKVKEAQAIYNTMIPRFCAYDNENYQTTVTKGIPAFFIHYDARFAPQDTIITMDYPTITPIINQSGIQAISKYLEYIQYEQTFLSILPRDYVCDILYRFQCDYTEQFFNICRIILRHVLVHMLLDTKLNEDNQKSDYINLRQLILQKDAVWIKERMMHLLEQLIQQQFDDDHSLKAYLQSDLKDFAIELEMAAKFHSLKAVVVL